LQIGIDRSVSSFSEAISGQQTTCFKVKMISTFAIILIAIPIYWIYSNISGLLRNIAAAKRSGLPYVIARQFTLPSFDPHD
jgi:hypothetical protein